VWAIGGEGDVGRGTRNELQEYPLEEYTHSRNQND